MRGLLAFLLFTPLAIPQQGISFAPLFSKIWKISNEPNGTLLMTSCQTAYRVPGWSVDKKTSRLLRVVEDGQLSFTAKIVELSGSKVRLQQKLVRSKEARELTLTPIEREFVCPGMR